MTMLITRAGAQIFSKACGPREAQPILFNPVRPLTADGWDSQTLFFRGKGFRVIAADLLAFITQGDVA